MEYQALYRKYRPQTFDAVYGQRHITRTLQSQVESGRVSHAYLFTGTRGTGKTTCAKLLARAVNCEHPVNGNPCNECPSCRGILDGSILDVLELDAASNTGVDNMRAILEETTYPPANVRRRVYIIDEVHMLSAGAFNALLKTLEEPPEYVMFILATTELHRVAATILSRCQRFDFKRVEQREIAANISGIAEREAFRIAPRALELLSKLADGSVRDSLSLLERCLIGHEGDTLEESDVIDAMGISSNESLHAIVSAIAAQDASAALLSLDRIYMDGRDIRSSLERLAAYFRDVLLYQTAPDAAAALSSPGFDRDALLADAKRFSPRHVMDITSLLQKTVDAMQRASGGRLDAELCLIRLCTPAVSAGDPTELAGRLAALETKLASGAFTLSAASAAPAPAPAPQPAPPPKAEPQPEPVPQPAPEPQRMDDDDCPFPLTDDDAPPPTEQDYVAPASPAPAPAPRPAPAKAEAEPAPAPRPAARAEIPSETKVAIIKALSGVLPRSVYTYLTLAKMYRDGNTLTLGTEGELSASLLDKADVRTAVAGAASKILNETVTVRVASAEKEKRRASAFDGFDQIMQEGQDAGLPIELK
ncbi:MAG: DNA polymerase III subunit gamma/tau [Ruminococcaceae bacterium]|nr:DNA polymerase III subunit gamma/tau [Oscillospiraceae bacterium]